MGLFGGFKAKFTRNSTTTKNKNEVVCLKYHIHSEFDGDNPTQPMELNNSIKKPDVSPRKPTKKERRALTKSVIFPDNETSLSSLSSASAQHKSLSLTNLNATPSPVNRHLNGHAEPTDPITISTTFTLPSNKPSVAISDTKYRKSTEEHNGVVREKAAVVTNNHLYARGHEEHNQTIFSKMSTYKEDKPPINTDISYLKPSSPKENKQKHPENDHSTLIYMTQHSSRSSSFDRNDDLLFTKNTRSNKIEENPDYTSDGNFNISFTPNRTTHDDDTDYFKINVVQHDPNKRYSYSEDEHSYQEEEPPRFARMGFSSQAASIFFGEGEEEEVMRPRRIQLTQDDEDDDDDERRSSGADC